MEGPLEQIDVIQRSALLDRYCAEIGRDAASVTRSIYLSVSCDQPDKIRESTTEAIEAGFRHLVLGLGDPYPEHVAHWIVSEIVGEIDLSGVSAVQSVR